MRDIPAIFLFVSEGTTKAGLEAWVQELGFGNVHFSFQPQDDYLKLLAVSDACLVSLKVGVERYALSSGVHTVLSAGKPIVGLLHPGNDISAILDSHNVDWNSTDAAGLALLVRRLCNSRDEVGVACANARELYISRFDRTRGIEACSRLFESLVR